MSEIAQAGGIVVRRDLGVLRFLVLTAKRDRTHWIFPKGHIEKGETAIETAVREVREESGVDALPGPYIDTIRFMRDGKAIRVDIYLLDYLRTADLGEARTIRWYTFEESLALLSFDDTKEVLRKALPLIENPKQTAE